MIIQQIILMALWIKNTRTDNNNNYNKNNIY